MASALYHVRTDSTQTASGRELLDVLNQINQLFGRLTTIRAAMIQQKDGSSGTATDYVTMATVFGIVDASNTISSTVAQSAFAEIDSFYGNGGPSLTQCCARFKQ
jgi:hypothetical protein